MNSKNIYGNSFDISLRPLLEQNMVLSFHYILSCVYNFSQTICNALMSKYSATVYRNTVLR